MRVLQICHKPPFPPKDGGSIAIKNISCGLADAGVDLTILTIETAKHPFNKDLVPEPYKSQIRIIPIYVDTSLNVVDAFSSLITADSYNVSRFFTPDVDIVLTNLLRKEQFDIIHLESLFVSPYIGTIKRLSKSKVVLRSHNLEFMIWERLADESKNVAKKTYLNILAKQLKRYETATINDVHGIVSISAEDTLKYNEFKHKTPVTTIPFGIDLRSYSVANVIKTNTFFHLGSLAWKPNLEGVLWFLKKIWPKFHAANPNSEFLLAGRDIPDEISRPYIPGVKIIGEVDNAQDFIKQNGVMVVPLHAGGGMRVKIIEGMALGIPIVTTRIGAEGIEHNGAQILVADNADSFIAQMKLCLNPEKLTELGKNSRLLATLKYDNKKLIDDLIAFYKKLISA